MGVIQAVVRGPFQPLAMRLSRLVAFTVLTSDPTAIALIKSIWLAHGFCAPRSRMNLVALRANVGMLRVPVRRLGLLEAVIGI